MSDATAVVEAAYALADDDQAWLSQLADTARDQLDQGSGLLAITYDATAPDWVELTGMAVSGLDPALASSFFTLDKMPESETRATVRAFRNRQVGTLRQSLRGLPQSSQYYGPVLARANLRDVLFVNATDPSQTGCLLGVPARLRERWAPRTAQRWRRIAAHVAAGMRIRRQLRQSPTPLLQTEGPSVEAILSPSGALQHALDPAKGPAARAVLRKAAMAFDRARGPLRRNNPDEAVAIWQGLVDGRWSLLDHFDSDGRRYIVAHRNDPNLPDLRGLTAREGQVLAYAMLGRSNKDIAYELGIATPTVGVHLSRARRKLGGGALAALEPALALGTSRS
jgi:hypothetical protein